MPYFGIPIRNGLPIGLGSVAGFGVQQFSPADLFSAGEQGAWYDPSDLTTLFTDSAGTTPVTAVEQFVGLMLDKSGRGNHATQTTSAKRPKLAARYNLLVGTDTLATQSVTTAATTYTLRFGGTGSIALTGTATGTYSAGTHSITATAGTLTLTVTGSVTTADLRPASQATGLIGPTYQRVVDAATYDAVGFLPYLVADGVDDAMNTGNIVPGTDKAQVFAAIRKLSDATEGVISEFSANSNTNNGAFILLPNSNGSTAAATNAFRSRGTTASGIGQFAISAAFTAPISEVVTAIGDISGDLSALRVNGSASGTNGTGDQGSGDYGNYPLYLFGRGGTSVYFNGWMYGLIIRFGPNLSTSQIESTEAYLNQKSGAY